VLLLLHSDFDPTQYYIFAVLGAIILLFVWGLVTVGPRKNRFWVLRIYYYSRCYFGGSIAFLLVFSGVA